MANRGNPMKSLAVAAVAIFAATPALSADCNGSHALDRCLIGTWQYESGGGAAWASRNIRGTHTTATNSDISLTFRGDGSFSTGHVDIHSSAVSSHGDISATGHSVGTATGTWSVAGNKFNLCATGVRTTVTVMVHGRSVAFAAPASQPHATAYTCSATALITTQPIPAHEPIVTAYRRSH